jgi:uncharacterized protein YndB with AHSA1/START domain
MQVRMHGRTHTLRAGDELTIPPGTPHAQRPGPEATGRVRIRLTPSARSDEFFTRLATLDYNRFGFPRPRSAAAFVKDLGEAGHAARPSLKTQQRIAGLLDSRFDFSDEWDVDAPIEQVFDTLADGTTYPAWWRGVYIAATHDGTYTHQHFKGRLPYHLRTRTRTVHAQRPHRLEGETDGDLRGTGVWTLAGNDDGSTHVRFDWRVHADRPLLRLLTPVARPVLRWNHAWAIARAIEGLEPYVKLTA